MIAGSALSPPDLLHLQPAFTLLKDPSTRDLCPGAQGKKDFYRARQIHWIQFISLSALFSDFISPLRWLPLPFFVPSDLSAPKKCRARFGLDQQNNWCGPCRCVSGVPAGVLEQSLTVGPPKVANEISMGVPNLRYVHLNGRYGSVWFTLRFRQRASMCPLFFFSFFRRKKKCIRYIQGEGSCASPPSSDGSLLDSPPSSPSMVSPSPSSKESKTQTEQMQPLSLTMKPPPLLTSSQHQHISMAPPLALLDNSRVGKTSGSAHNGSLEPSDMSSSRPTGSTSSRPTSVCHSHSLLPSSATTQPLSLVTKSID
ncbi:hypothetical protein cypCar_00035833 [Cyprinus carpio]|nr:hypothetical protein cypCar_00035833 [Cyprinus carpio]